MDKIKQLLDELAAVVAEMEAMSEAPAEDGEAMPEEQIAALVAQFLRDTDTEPAESFAGLRAVGGA